MSVTNSNQVLPLVSGPILLALLFERTSKPSLRWLRTQQKNRTIPYIRIGRRIFFDPVAVRTALGAKNTINAKNEKNRKAVSVSAN